MKRCSELTASCIPSSPDQRRGKQAGRSCDAILPDFLVGAHAAKIWPARCIPIADPAATAFAHLSQRQDFLGADDFVFCSRLSRALDDSAVPRRFKAAVAAAGLLKFHAMRHGAGSMIARQADAPRLAEVDDWELLLALYHHARPWDGLITTDSSMTKQAPELGTLIETKLTLVVAEASGHNPVKASGLLFAHLAGICRLTDPNRPQSG